MGSNEEDRLRKVGSKNFLDLPVVANPTGLKFTGIIFKQFN
jgi:hypothetical protein